jgi:hypothetical protein
MLVFTIDMLFNPVFPLLKRQQLTRDAWYFISSTVIIKSRQKANKLIIELTIELVGHKIHTNNGKDSIFV